MRHLAAAVLVVLATSGGITWYCSEDGSWQERYSDSRKVEQPGDRLADKLHEFDKLVHDPNAAGDDDVVEIIESVLVRFDELHPRDKKAFAKALYEPLEDSRIKREAMDCKLFEASVVALGKTQEEGSKYLVQAFQKKKFKDKGWLPLRAKMLVNLGMTKDLKQTDFLVDVALKDIHGPLMAAAGKALGEFADAPLEVRKEIAKDLIKKFVNIYENANANLDPGDLERRAWEDRYKAVADPWNGALKKLTGQPLRTPNDWQRFYNQHKSEDWDKR